MKPYANPAYEPEPEWHRILGHRFIAHRCSYCGEYEICAICEKNVVFPGLAGLCWPCMDAAAKEYAEMLQEHLQARRAHLSVAK